MAPAVSRRAHWVREGARNLRVRSIQGLILILSSGAIVLCIFAILFLSSRVANQIEVKSTAESDQLSWSLAQLEVELIAFRAAVDDALIQPEQDLAGVRAGFDILYSRVGLLTQGSIYGPLWDTPDTAVALRRLKDFVRDGTSLFELPDDGLRPLLPRLRAEVDALRPSSRLVALRGVQVSSELADEKRVEFLRTLKSLALLTIALIAVLLISVVALTVLQHSNARRAERERLMKERLGAVIANSLDAIIVLDHRDRIIEFNEVAERTFGYLRDSVIGRHADWLFDRLLAGDDLDGPGDEGRSATLRGLSGTGLITTTARRQDESTFPVEMAVNPLPHWINPLCAVFIRDVTDRQKHELELRKARDLAIAGEKAKQAMLLVMSHEIRTPLNGLLGTLQLLEDTALDDEQARLVEVMRSSGEFLMEHVNDVLDVSQIDAGKILQRTEVFVLQTLIRDIVANQTGLAQSRGNSLRFVDRLAAPQPVESDPRWLRQILLNLVSNANKFTEGGEIAIELDRDGTTGRYRISVRDAGVGIAPANLDRIFQDFVTIDQSYERTSGGTGLGLGIVRRLVRKLDGALSVQSELGKGSTFTVELPLHEAALPDPPDMGRAPEAAGTAAARPLSILVAEDNAINRFVLREILLRDGHNVTEAHDGWQAVEQARERAFDLILMDISMPRMSGISATREIRAGTGPNRGTPVIALTAHTTDPTRFLKSGMTGVLIKPVSRTQLEKMLATLFSPQDDAETDAGDEPDEVLDDAQLDNMLSVLPAERFFCLLDKYVAETDMMIRTEFPAGGQVAADDRLALRAHAEAGSAATFGLFHLRNALLRVEAGIVGGDTARLDGLLSDLTRSWEATREALRQWRSANEG